MRPIHKVRLDKVRPAVILTRAVAASFLNALIVAPITTTTYGIATEVPVGPDNGLDAAGVVSCDNIVTVPAADVLERIGSLRDDEEARLALAIQAAFDLEPTSSGRHSPIRAATASVSDASATQNDH